MAAYVADHKAQSLRSQIVEATDLLQEQPVDYTACSAGDG